MEFWAETSLLAPWLKGWGVVSGVGLAAVVAGQVVRTAAMWAAGANFTHVVEDGPERRPEHALVTHGVYTVLRHPSYAGWFWWSVGTQALLGNPVCAAAYAAAAWRFFAGRIPGEEAALARYFGREYGEWARGRWVGIPWVPTAVDGEGRGDE